MDIKHLTEIAVEKCASCPFSDSDGRHYICKLGGLELGPIKRDMGASLESLKVSGNCPLIGRPHVVYLA